jgi:hypothetical protein
MHAIDLLAGAMTDDRVPPHGLPVENGVCCITAGAGPTIPRRALLSKSFTDGTDLLAPGSDRVGLNAWKAFMWNEPRGRRGFHPERMSSWLCTADRFTRLDRAGLRAAVLGDPPPAPWAGYATTSYKKHGALRAPVNTASTCLWLFETRVVDCSDRDRVARWWQELTGWQADGLSRPIIETLDCPIHVMRKIGYAAWMTFYDWAWPIHRGPLYAFLCYLLPSKKETADAGAAAA